MFETLNFTGLGIGLCTFLIIGLFHPLVIKGEYYFGLKVNWAFGIAGVITGVAAVLCQGMFLSCLLAVIAFSCFWSIKEVFDQQKRVAKGWFPANPNKIKKQATSKSKTA